MSGFTDRIIASMAGGLVVSCQAYPGEPLRHPETMAQMAAAVEAGGAVAGRAQGLSDVSAVKGRVSVPVVGIWKEGDEGIYITPTLRHARCVSAAGADVVALDGTRRERADGLSLAETIERLKREYDVVVMADCGSGGGGVVAGGYFAWLGISSIFRTADTNVQIHFGVDWPWTIGLILICMAAAALASILPGSHDARTAPTEALAEE